MRSTQRVRRLVLFNLEKTILMMMFPRGCVSALMLSVLLSGCGGEGGGNQGSGSATFPRIDQEDSHVR
jgi:hypothetical protein